MKMILKYYGPAIWWALFILILCNMSLGKVGDSPLFFPGFDKLVHCGLFFVLMIFTAYGRIRQYGRRRYTITTGLSQFLLIMFFGGLIELLQKFIFTWRSGEWNDLFADGVGTSMAVFSILVILYASAKNEKA